MFRKEVWRKKKYFIVSALNILKWLFSELISCAIIEKTLNLHSNVALKCCTLCALALCWFFHLVGDTQCILQSSQSAGSGDCDCSPCYVLPSIGKNTSPCAGGESGVPGSDNRWRPVSDDCLVMICDTVRVLVCGDPPRNTGFSWPRASLHTYTHGIAQSRHWTLHETLKSK